jgi:hypothetical protein
MYKRVKFLVEFEVNLDSLPGWGHQVEDWQKLVMEDFLRQTCYKPEARVVELEVCNGREHSDLALGVPERVYYFQGKEISEENVRKLVEYLPTLYRMLEHYRLGDFSHTGANCLLCDKARGTGGKWDYSEYCKECPWGTLYRDGLDTPEDGLLTPCNVWSELCFGRDSLIGPMLKRSPAAQEARIYMLEQWIQFIEDSK